MITSVYSGGLGNQLFQVVAGYFLAKDNNDEYGINPDLSKGLGQGSAITAYTDSIFKNVKKTKHAGLNLYTEPQFNYTAIEYSEDLLLEGYFQSEKYFLNKRDAINELLDFRCDEAPTNVCVIHVRTGDYLNRTEFDVVTPRYFQNAINYVLSINPAVVFKVVADNDSHALRYIPSDIKYEFVSSDDELRDLRTISQCDYSIISNSSFAWWGSYLGKGKMTLAPSTWFNVNYSVADVYRNDMIQIEI